MKRYVIFLLFKQEDTFSVDSDPTPSEIQLFTVFGGRKSLNGFR